ncbi:hypothetical protein AVEN_20952-1 [Araneus ventricosus]|uniref:Tc1-like transposase DDE domain-containing protein n=1 Tax=Araneus ventricosus TaxID=182803 RepID=A0A4Y2QL96_ARAVE|nr:hypothetical protein AVEN_20952-1 [Araneus ventricosus]
MGKAAELSEFDRGQIVMARRLGTSIAETVRLDNAPCHKVRFVWEWFEEHTDEFHLMSWPPNSPDLNPMEHIWDVMERQLRAQTPPCPNISTLRDRCLDIWYNLSPVMYQKLVASMPRRVVAVLKAKGGATHY